MKRKKLLLATIVFFITVINIIAVSHATPIKSTTLENYVDYDNDVYERNINREILLTISAILTILQFFSMGISLLLIVFLIKYFYYRVKLSTLNLKFDVDKSLLNRKIEIEKKIEKTKANVKISAIIMFIAFLLSGLKEIAFGYSSKPIIYLYPEHKQEVSVVLGNERYLTCTYPKYEKSWEVIAKPDGNLIDKKTGRNLYSLYWEGKKTRLFKNINEGFCIKGEDSAEFLEEKLAILGLSEREAEEFIVYWLPKLESNRYNLIRFESIDEINAYMPLEIMPKPDTVIRVMMEFKESNKYVDLPEQILKTPQRNGFVVVEWGGTEL